MKKIGMLIALIAVGLVCIGIIGVVNSDAILGTFIWHIPFNGAPHLLPIRPSAFNLFAFRAPLGVQITHRTDSDGDSSRSFENTPCFAATLLHTRFVRFVVGFAGKTKNRSTPKQSPRFHAFNPLHESVMDYSEEFKNVFCRQRNVFNISRCFPFPLAIKKWSEVVNHTDEIGELIAKAFFAVAKEPDSTIDALDRTGWFHSVFKNPE